MRRSIGACLAVACAALFLAAPARAVLIDTFATTQIVTGPQPPFPGHSSIEVADPLPATRSIGVAGSIDPDSATGSIGGGSLSYTTPGPSVYRTMGVAWLLASPLDVTDSGASIGIPILVAELTLDTDLIVSMRACGTGPLCANASSYASIHLTGAGFYFVPFSAFAIAPGAVAPVDFSAVTHVNLQLSPISGTPGGTVRLVGPLHTVPEPQLSVASDLAALALAASRLGRRRGARG